MALFSKFARRAPLPAVATYLYQSQWSSCDIEKPAPEKLVESEAGTFVKDETNKSRSAGMHASEEGEFYGLFPKRQLWQPRVEYPLWDDNWDGRKPPSTGDKENDRERMRQVRKTGVTRHIILIRHGQYDENYKEDDKRTLTELGRKQADLTGKRIAEMIQGTTDKSFGPCKVKLLRVSNLTRAKETADIIARHLPDVERAEPDPGLNEGRPAHTIPGPKAPPKVIDMTEQHHPRIEDAYRRIFFRSEQDEDETDDDGVDANNDDGSHDKETHLHEFEIVVGHANVIRYFICRALQLPPECWLRLCTFNCSLTYLTVRPTGTVSCRMLGDIGHIPYGMSTFSGHHGFNCPPVVDLRACWHSDRR